MRRKDQSLRILPAGTPLAGNDAALHLPAPEPAQAVTPASGRLMHSVLFIYLPYT